ncbi:TOBE domain-containing protein [Cellulomonas soli]
MLIGIRPEKVRILVEGQEPQPQENVLGPGVVTDVSFTGVSTQYQVEVAGLGTFGVFAQNLLGGATVSHGARVRLAWTAAYTFALDGREDLDSGLADLDDEP